MTSQDFVYFRCVYPSMALFGFFFNNRSFEKIKNIQNDRVFNADSKYIIRILKVFFYGREKCTSRVPIYPYFSSLSGHKDIGLSP